MYLFAFNINCNKKIQRNITLLNMLTKNKQTNRNIDIELGVEQCIYISTFKFFNDKSPDYTTDIFLPVCNYRATTRHLYSELPFLYSFFSME